MGQVFDWRQVWRCFPSAAWETPRGPPRVAGVRCVPMEECPVCFGSTDWRGGNTCFRVAREFGHTPHMPDISSVLKSEIARIARKEVRSQAEAHRKYSARYRHDIAELRRRLEELERAVKRGTKPTRAPAVNEAESSGQGDGGGLRFRAAGFAAHRKRLGLSAEDFGKLIGVSGQSIYKWETGAARPRRSQLPAIAAARRLGKREAQAKLEELTA